MRTPWAVLVVAVVVGFLAGAFLADFRNAQTRGRAEAAEHRALELRERVRADSLHMVTLREEYEAERAAHMASTAASMEARRRAEAEATAHRLERVALVARSDSLAGLLADTTTVVSRSTWEAARTALAAAVADAEAQGRRADALAAESASWRLLWAQADSGWSMSIQQVAGLNAALTAQIHATEAWKKAASTSWGVRVKRAFPTLVTGGVLCYTFCPARR